MPRKFTTISERGQSGNSPNAETCGHFREVLCIHLDHDPATGAPCSDLGDFGRDHLARGAPWRPKIDERRQCGFADERLKLSGSVDVNRLCGLRQLGVTLTASELLAKALEEQAVATTALRTCAHQTAFINFKASWRCGHDVH